MGDVLSRFNSFKTQKEHIKTQITEIDATIKAQKEQEDKILKTLKDSYGINSLEELEKKVPELKEEIEKILTEAEKVLSSVEEEETNE